MKHRLSFIQELLFDFEKTMNSFFETAKFTGEHNYKKANKIGTDWKKIIDTFNDLHEFVTPIEAIEVKRPEWFTPKVEKMWKLWKEYLAEQHNIFMKSRLEVTSLERLKELCDSDPEEANKILHFAIANNYMRFFKLNIKQDEQPKESPIAIPDRY